MEKADKVTLRLTADQASAIDFLVESGKFKNRSKAIRSAIDDLISIPGEEEHDRPRVNITLPDTMIAEIDTLVDLDYFQSRDQGIWELLRNGLLQINIDDIKDRKQERTSNLADRMTFTQNMFRSKISGERTKRWETKWDALCRGPEIFFGGKIGPLTPYLQCHFVRSKQ